MNFNIPSKLVFNYCKAKQEIKRLGKKESTFVELSQANGKLDQTAKELADYVFEMTSPSNELL